MAPKGVPVGSGWEQAGPQSPLDALGVALDHAVAAGAPASALVLGLPFYGKVSICNGTTVMSTLSLNCQMPCSKFSRCCCCRCANKLMQTFPLLMMPQTIGSVMGKLQLRGETPTRQECQYADWCGCKHLAWMH